MSLKALLIFMASSVILGIPPSYADSSYELGKKPYQRQSVLLSYDQYGNIAGEGVNPFYQITDGQSADCDGDWFIVERTWAATKGVLPDLCWKNNGSQIEIKEAGIINTFKPRKFFEKPSEIGDRELSLESATNYAEFKRGRKIEKQRASDNSDAQFYAERPIKDFPYLAKISCTLGSNQLPMMACMQRGNMTTNIEIRSGQDYSMAQFTNLNIANSMGSNGGLTVLLRPTFQIKMQNASNEMTMNLEILDRQSNAVAYKKSAGQFDYISASNNLISRSNPQVNSEQYEAEISCGNQPVFTCFMRQGGIYGSFNTTLEIRSGNFYRLYQYQDLINSGALMNVPLGSSFNINAQNSNNTFLLNIKIKDKTTKKVIFEKSAGQFDFIRIRN
jgi:ribosomal protein S21